MTIHSEHPFVPPESERDPVRRLRGRLGGTVTLWTAGTGESRAGLTVSSVMLAAGQPAHFVALLDPDCDLVEVMDEGRTAVVQLLEWEHRNLADAFAGQFPAPGGAFRQATWVQTDWGPLLQGASAWAGVRLTEAGAEPGGRMVGWSRLVDCVVEHVQIGQEVAPLVHRRGRYLKPGG